MLAGIINAPLVTIVTVILILITGVPAAAQSDGTDMDAASEDDHLIILWTSGDPEVAEKMLFMYSHAAKEYGWFKEVTIVVWGPSARLLAAHKDLQEKVKAMQKSGVIFEACVACASQYGVVEDLKALGIDVKGMGGPLTEYIKSKKHVITI